MEDVTPVQEQAARLQAAFEEGAVWTVRGPGDEHPTYEHAPVVPGLRPGYAFTIGDFRCRACVVVEFSLDGGPPGLRWLHRFRPPSPAGWQPDVLSDFQEGVDCWIGRSLARVPAGTSPVWTDFSWGHPAQRWIDALELFADDDLTLAAEMPSADPPDDEARALAERIAGLRALGDAPDAAPLRETIYETFHWRIHSPHPDPRHRPGRHRGVHAGAPQPGRVVGSSLVGGSPRLNRADPNGKCRSCLRHEVLLHPQRDAATLAR